MKLQNANQAIENSKILMFENIARANSDDLRIIMLGTEFTKWNSSYVDKNKNHGPKE